MQEEREHGKICLGLALALIFQHTKILNSLLENWAKQTNLMGQFAEAKVN